MRAKIHIIAWVLLTLALGAWGAIWYAGTYLVSEASLRASNATTAEQQLDKVAYAQRLEALAVDTQEERGRLEALTHLDIVSIINVIESTGKNAGVSTRVSDALPVGGTQTLSGNVPLQSIQFIVEAQGSFPALMRAVDAFEHLALPSAIDQLEFQHDAGTSAKSSWHLVARIRVLTTAAVSS